MNCLNDYRLRFHLELTTNWNFEAKKLRWSVVAFSRISSFTEIDVKYFYKDELFFFLHSWDTWVGQPTTDYWRKMVENFNLVFDSWIMFKSIGLGFSLWVTNLVIINTITLGCLQWVWDRSVIKWDCFIILIISSLYFWFLGSLIIRSYVDRYFAKCFNDNFFHLFIFFFQFHIDVYNFQNLED